MLLMELQPLLRTQTGFARHGVNAYTSFSCSNNVTALGGEVFRNIYYLPPSSLIWSTR